VVASLWGGASQRGLDIDHLSLSKHFTSTGATKKLEELREVILAADGLILGEPVYFGDRGSLAQDFVDLIGSDQELRYHLRNKIYAGVAVEPKRNGGQEINLIYQLNDMTNLGMLGVGNDSKTTSQYGELGSPAMSAPCIRTSTASTRALARVDESAMSPSLLLLISNLLRRRCLAARRYPQRAGASLRNPELVFKPGDGLAATVRGHHFSSARYFNIALSSSASANSFFNAAFSVSSSFRRFKSLAFIPPH